MLFVICLISRDSYICVTVLAFVLNLSEGLIFIPQITLVFARANAGVGGRGVGGTTGNTNRSLFVGIF